MAWSGHHARRAGTPPHILTFTGSSDEPNSVRTSREPVSHGSQCETSGTPKTTAPRMLRRMTDHLPRRVVSEMIGALVPGASALTESAISTVAAEWSKNRSATMRAAVRTSGLSREDLDARIIAHPELVPLVTRMLHYATMSGRHKKLEMLGAVFGAAALDPSRIDELEATMVGLDVLRSEDAAVLRECRNAPVFYPASDEQSPDIQNLGNVSARLGVSDEYVAGALGRLTGAGFVRQMSVFGGDRYEVTELGRTLFDVLERLDDL